METSKLKLESLEQEYDQLKVDYKFLNSSLNEPNVTNEYNKAVKQFELNRARLNYLDATILSLNQNLEQKSELITHLENEFDYVGGLVEARLGGDEAVFLMNESSSTTTSSSESSSESISNLLSDIDLNNKVVNHNNRNNCGNNNKRINIVYKSPESSSDEKTMMINDVKFDPEDIYYF